MVKVTYTFPGYYSYINLSSTYQRLFFLPSEECHNQGIAVIREITDLLKNKALDVEEKHLRIDDVYIRKCYTTSSLGTTMTTATTAFATSSEIINISAATTTTTSTQHWRPSILTSSTETTKISTTMISSEAKKLNRANETLAYTWIIIFYLASLCVFLTITVFSCFLCQLLAAKKYLTFKNSKVQDVSLTKSDETILTQINI